MDISSFHKKRYKYTFQTFKIIIFFFVISRMNCYRCHLMFNNRGRRVTFQCGYSFHQSCLRRSSEIIAQNCPIKGHSRCRPVQEQLVDSYINNSLDKKVKVVFVGRKGVGKTSLIKSMNNRPLDNTRHTVSIDFVSITRTVNQLQVQYNLWDTVSQSTIFQGFDSTFKNSDVQIIVERGQTANEIMGIFEYVQQNTLKPHIIIVSNQMAGIGNENIEEELADLLKERKYRYLKFNCMDQEKAKLMWEMLDFDCIKLKENESKLMGPVPSRLKKRSQSKKRTCLC